MTEDDFLGFFAPSKIKFPISQFRAVQLTLIGRGIEGSAGTSGQAVPVAQAATAVAPPPILNAAGARSVTPPPVAVESVSVPHAPQASVEFFVQEGCAECLLLRREFLPSLAARYGGRLRPVVSDTHDRATFLRLLDTLEACSITANEPLYLVVNGSA